MHKSEEMKANIALCEGTLLYMPFPPCISNVLLQLESKIPGGGKTEELLLEAT